MNGLLPLCLSALATAAIYLETWAVGQFLIGRPAVLLPLTGLLTGQLETGLWMGLSLELLLLREMPLGAASPPDPVLGGFLGLVAVNLAGDPADSTEARIFAGLLLAVGLSYLAAWHTHWQRQVNTRFWYDRFEQAVELDEPESVDRLFWLAMLGTAVMAATFGLLVLLLATPVAGLLLQGQRLLPAAPTLFKWMVLATAVGTGMKLGTGRRPGPWLLLGWLGSVGIYLIFLEMAG
ncbi:MAG: PTS sugar transporter subunit IIC [Calditrichaeota bacterium]|nr:PTS sugar transporter subunit IIC [Candidatus Cloacimonadota bacterium]MCB1045930.1 PTS sugar transporter subunit IIC [Calditrichota bacterium]